MNVMLSLELVERVNAHLLKERRYLDAMIMELQAQVAPQIATPGLPQPEAGAPSLPTA